MKNIFTLLSLLVTTTLFSQTVLFQEDFEGTINMTSSSTGSGLWAVNSRLQSEGLKSDSATVTMGDTTYLTINSSVDASSYPQLYLQFSQIAKVEFFDGCEIEVSTNGGSSWTKLMPLQYLGSGYFANGFFSSASYATDWQGTTPSAVPQNSWWKNELFDISSIAGSSSSVKVRFVLSDRNNSGSAGNAGWFIDNIVIYGAASELIPPSITLLSPVFGLVNTVDTVYGSGPFDIIASITDASGIDTAIVIYQNSTGFLDTLGMNLIGTDSFHAAIPFSGYGRTLTYYVKAVDASMSQNSDSTESRAFFCKYSAGGNVVIGTGIASNTSNSYPSPYANYYWGNRVQYIILASEMGTAGSGPIESVAFDVSSVNSCPNLQNFEIKIGATTMSSSTAFVPNSDMTTVLSNTGGYQPIAGWNIHTLTSPFIWDGISNIVIQVCSNNSGYVNNGNASVKYSTTSFNSLRYYYGDMLGVCNATTVGVVGSQRANISIVLEGAGSLTHDIGVNQIINPISGVAAGTPLAVDVSIKNFGIDTINYAKVYWKYDGIVQSPFYTFTDSLKVDSVSSSLSIGTVNPTVGMHSITAWTEDPDNIVDFNFSNDSSSVNFYACSFILNGSYTIDPSGSGATNYTSFSDAVLALSQCGINGAVTFNIASGVYNEQIMLPPINGASATNTVTFQSISGDSSTVFLKYNANNMADNYVVDLDGASYITFKNMSIEAEDTIFSNVFVLENTVHDFAVENCVVKASVPSTTDGNTMNLFFSVDTLGSNISIQHNMLINSAYAINLKGFTSSTNWVVNDNTIHGQYAEAIHLENAVSAIVTNNDIKADTNSTYSGYEGIYLLNNTGSALISKNKIYTQSIATGNAIRMTSCLFDSLNPTNVVNNFVQMHVNSAGTALSAGILNNESRFVNIYYNTIRMSGVQLNSPAMCLFDGTAGLSRGITMVNNIFTNDANGYVYYVNNVDTSLWVDHHNDLFNFASTADFAYLGAGVGDYTNWITESGAASCENIDPFFISATDLHVSNNYLNDLGTPIAGISDDYDGDLRDIVTPDMGADEFDASSNDIATLELTTPYSGCGLSNAELVSIRYVNLGSASITSFDAEFSLVGSSTIVSEPVTTTINPGDTLDYVFSATLDLDVSALGSDSAFIIQAWGVLIGDSDHANDSIEMEVYSGYVLDTVHADNDTIVYGGSATLYATGNSIYWWESDTASVELGKDTMFVTGPLYDTTTYWVSDRAGAGLMDVQIGTGVITNSGSDYPTPYGNYYWGNKEQYLILASELTAMGIGAGPIASLQFDVTAVNNCPSLSGYELKMGQTNVGALSTWITGLTSVYNPGSYTPVVGWNEHLFSTPYVWDGVSNLVVQVCFNNSSYDYNASVNNSITTFNSVLNYHADNSTVCSNMGI
ncbi:MAG: hypothetical protein KAG64_08940, partial [Bacteroidales bacterium]|nr:hypothetical protein [Bacteroidales bacterium]